MKDNFDILFETSTNDELDLYFNTMRRIRKGAKTKKQKVNALNQQMQLMNLMHNAGHEAGGSSIPTQLNAHSNDFLQMFHSTDINSLWEEMNIPANRTSSSIIGDVKNVYGVMKYLDFTSNIDESIDDQNVNVDVKDITDTTRTIMPDGHSPTIAEYNKQRRAMFEIRDRRRRIGRRGEALPLRHTTPAVDIRSETPEPVINHPIIDELHNNQANDDTNILQQTSNNRKQQKKQKKKKFDEQMKQRRKHLYESSDDESNDSSDDIAVSTGNNNNVRDSFVSEYSNYTPQGNNNSKSKSKTKPKIRGANDGIRVGQKGNYFTRASIQNADDKQHYDMLTSTSAKKQFLRTIMNFQRTISRMGTKKDNRFYQN